MVDAAKLKDLLAKIEATAKGSRELDADVYEALGYEVKRGASRTGSKWTRSYAYLDRSRWCAMSHLTASIDAALALVERMKPGVWWHIAKGRLTDSEPLFSAELLFGDMESLGHGEAATAPLAVLSALLRSLRSIEGGERG